YLSQVLEKISQNEYDYIIIENRPQFVLPIKKITKSKIILHIHNDYLCGDSKDDISIINACYKILVVSDYMKQKMIKNLKYYEDKIIVLYNGIDSNRFNKKLSEKQRIKIREDYGIKKDDFVIIFTGRLIEQKGILQLLRAVKKIQSVENIKVLIVGSSWYSSDSITEYVARLHDESKSIKDKIIFTGYIDYNKLNKLYDVADIAVLPSMWEEPLGMVILEAMSMQLPVISTNSGGIVEVITDKENGFLFDRDSKLEDNIAITIQKLYKYKSLCNLIGNNARDLIENKFNTKIYYNNFIKILK
ncbi:glycosyltransferase family 4 protein, partial [Clostridium saudiense]|nr:glycosyltransferase family 4 protein [Clostridium saudiense]